MTARLGFSPLPRSGPWLGESISPPSVIQLLSSRPPHYCSRLAQDIPWLGKDPHQKFPYDIPPLVDKTWHTPGWAGLETYCQFTAKTSKVALNDQLGRLARPVGGKPLLLETHPRTNTSWLTLS